MTDNGKIGYEISGMIRGCNAMQPYQRPDCPRCGYALEESIDHIRHCKLCGFVDQFYVTRDTGRPTVSGI